MSESCFQNTMDSVLNLFLKELRFDLKKKLCPWNISEKALFENFKYFSHRNLIL